MNFKEFSELNLKRTNVLFNQPVEAWSLSEWAVALTEEVGEACGEIKRMNRVRDNVTVAKHENNTEQLKLNLSNELGDVYAYLDLLAQAAGLDLFDDCIKPKFNSVSQRFPNGEEFIIK